MFESLLYIINENENKQCLKKTYLLNSSYLAIVDIY